MTWFQYHNYGTALQAVALNRAIARLGFDVDVVDYRTSGKVVTAPEQIMPSWAVRSLRKRIRGKVFLAPFVSVERDGLFDSFLSEGLTFTKHCETKSDLESLNDSYGIFVCGSDQIWLPTAFDPRYYLDFAGDNSLKIAYAPSVGLAEVRNQDVARRMGELAMRIDCLSVREEPGRSIISQLTGREVATVLDPTMLIDADAWREEMNSSFDAAQGDYLLAYMLGRNESHWQRIGKLAAKLGLEVKIIPVFARDVMRAGCLREPVGPQEFLALVANASYVCTDSFHGVLFSIIFERDFCVFERFRRDDAGSQNSRVYGILSKLGLEARLAVEGVAAEGLASPVDWESVRSLVAADREASYGWLASSLATKLPAESGKRDVLRDRTLCCGCAACAVACQARAITVELDEEGFWRAVVDEGACVSCGGCRKVCPFIERGEALPVDVGSLYSFKSFDPNVLLTSSSGGAAATIAKKYGASGCAVLGCKLDAEHHMAVHRLVEPENAEGLASLSGSKYLQSFMSSALAQAALCEDPVVVFGTPCQVAGARNLFAGRSDVLYVDLVCHGVPTRHLYERYLDWLRREYGLDPGRTRTDFRYKPRGWRRIHLYSTDGEREACVHQRRDPYFLLFETGLCYAKCCYECPWRSSSAADVRLGDYWGPRFEKDKTGVSMVLSMTERSREIVAAMAGEGDLRPQPIDDYLRWQQTKNAPQPVFRERLIQTLTDSGTCLGDIVVEFATPMARRRDVMRALSPLVKVSKAALAIFESRPNGRR